jgi:hypothetical protein
MLAQTTQQEAAQASAEQRLEAARLKDSKPSLPIDRYAGQYTNEMYGDININLAADKLVLQFGPSLTGDLEPWSKDSYKIVWRDRREGTGLVEFIVNPVGAVSALRFYQPLTPAALRSPDVDEFRRIASPASTVGAR